MILYLWQQRNLNLEENELTCYIAKLTSSAYQQEGVDEGTEGYIVECFKGGHYYVEFSNDKGETLALLVLDSSEFDVIED